MAGERTVTENPVLGRLLAYQGRDGCTDARCTQIDGRCVGWHCPSCHAPTSSQGHDCPRRTLTRGDVPTGGEAE